MLGLGDGLFDLSDGLLGLSDGLLDLSDGLSAGGSIEIDSQASAAPPARWRFSKLNIDARGGRTTTAPPATAVNDCGIGRLRGFCRRVAALLPIVAVVSAATAFSEAPPPSQEGGAETARQLLRDHGLTLAGRHWLDDAEIRLLGQLDSLDRVQKQLRQAQKFIDDRIAKNEEHRRQRDAGSQLIAARKSLRVPDDATSRKRVAEELARLTAQQAALEAQYLPPQRFAEEPRVRRAVVEWINARNALAVAVLGYPRLLALAQSRYESLKSNPEVGRALKLLGGDGQLGSGRKYSTYRRRLEDARRVGLSPEVPLYRLSGQWRTSILLGEARPAACTFVDGPGPMLLPDSVARAAGIAAPPGAPLLLYAVGDGRQFPLRKVRVAQLRLGSHLFRDVEAYLLPPEGEDLGTQLTRQTLPYFQVHLEPGRARLTIEPK